MVNRNLIRSLENDPALNALFELEIADVHQGDSVLATIESEAGFDVNMIVDGKVLRVDDESVLIDVGFKSEGRIPLSEWEPGEEPPTPGANHQSPDRGRRGSDWPD